MRFLAWYVSIFFCCVYGHALADDRKDALINSYLGEYSLVTECDLFYYGIGRPRNFKRARECYGYDPFKEVLSVANGHGAKRDLARAENLARELAHPMKEQVLRDLQQLATATTKRELDPCDYASNTPEFSYCTKLSKLREEVRIYEIGSPYRNHEDERIRNSWLKLELAVKDFSAAERNFVYDSLEGGSMQSYGPGAAVVTILSNHRVNLQRLLDHAPRDDMTVEDYQRVDHDLNEKYQRMLEYYENRQLRRKLIQAQRKWIKYRDAMVEFFQATNSTRHPRDKVALDVMIVLTQQRIDMW